MWKRILQIIKKEIIQVLRDPRMRVILFLPPIVEVIIFGYAINMDIAQVKMGWLDPCPSPTTLELKAAFQGSPYFQITYSLTHEGEIKGLLDQGKVKAVLRILPQFSRNILRGDTTGIQILLDGTDSNTASLVSSYTQQIISQYAEGLSEKRKRLVLINMTSLPSAYSPITSSAPEKPGIITLNLPSLTVKQRVWFNPELKSRNYFVTGVIVNIIALVTIMLTAMAIVREKEIGTMEQLMVTPIRPIELILGKTIPFALVGLIDVALISLVAKIVFKIPYRGSITMLFLTSLLFLLTSLGAGLFISTISSTQQQALMTTFFFMMPSIMLSGFAFPIRNMPQPVQLLTYLNPLRYFMEILRSLFLKGTGVSILWPQMLGLFILGVLVMSLSVLRFHKRLD